MPFFLSTYHPLCYRRAGREAVSTHGHPPFVDASCRREPDFESAFPSISAVCHCDRFVPRLLKGDRVAFMTVKGRYLGYRDGHWRLVAALEVIERFESHEAAAAWYRKNGLRPPSNCMVRGSTPLGLDHTAHPEKDLRRWDLGYWKRTRLTGVFLVCRALALELNAPPLLRSDDLTSIFGRPPATRNPPGIAEAQFDALLQFLDR